MSAYTGDVNVLTCKELETKLRELAEAWRNEPHLSNGHSDGVRYWELKEVFEEKCGETCTIKGVLHPTDYQAVFV